VICGNHYIIKKSERFAVQYTLMSILQNLAMLKLVALWYGLCQMKKEDLHVKEGIKVIFKS